MASGFGGGSGFGRGGGASGGGAPFSIGAGGPINVRALPGTFSNGGGGAAAGGGVIAQFVASLGMKVNAASFVKAGLALAGIHAGLVGIARAAREVVTSVPRMIGEVAAMGVEASKLANRAGVTTDFIQELGYIGGRTGLTMEFMATRMAFLSRNMIRASEGVKEPVKAFKDLGISVNGLDKLKPEEVFEKLIVGFNKLDKLDPHREAAALTIFGRGGANFMDVVGASPEAFKAAREEAHKFGVVMSAEGIRDAQAYTNSMVRLHAALRGIKILVLGPLVHGFTKIFDGVQQWVMVNRSLLRQGFNTFLGLAAAALKFVWFYLKLFVNVIIQAVKWVAAVIKGLWQASAALGTLGRVIAAVAIAWFAWTSFAAAPLFVLLSIIGLLLLAFEDFVGYMEGKDSVIGRLIDKFANKLESSDNPILHFMGQLLHSIEMIRGAWDGFIDSLNPFKATSKEEFAKSMYGVRQFQKQAADAASRGDISGVIGNTLGSVFAFGAPPEVPTYTTRGGQTVVGPDARAEGMKVEIHEVHLHPKTDDAVGFAHAFTDGVLRATQEAVKK